MEKPGESVTISKEREGVNCKEKGEEGGWIEGHEMQAVLGIDCGWSLLSHGMAERRRYDLGNLNPI